MNLLNIPKQYIPTLDEMVILDVLVKARIAEGTSTQYGNELLELQRKLSLLDGIFRGAEEPDWMSFARTAANRGEDTC